MQQTAEYVGAHGVTKNLGCAKAWHIEANRDVG